jgi:hypothetical protein
MPHLLRVHFQEVGPTLQSYQAAVDLLAQARQVTSYPSEESTF